MIGLRIADLRVRLPGKWVVCCVVACGLALSGIADAHRGQDVLTVIEIDDRTGEVLTTHHFAAHDIEPMLPRLAPSVPANLDDSDAQAAFTAHLTAAFALSTDQGPVTLAFDRLQLAGDDVQVRYRGRSSPSASRLVVRSNLADDFAHDSTHQVNVRRSGITRTLVFESADGTATLDFDRGAPAGR